MGYIPQHALENLKNYQYKGVDKSILSKYVLGPYWTWLVTLWPTWVAPNVITLSGLSMVLANFATMIYYDPKYLAYKGGAAGPPQWMYFTWAAGLFIYQSFDAIDGKQARRTGMQGPLGEMFDHGCDALNTTLEVLLTCQALNLGRSWWTVSSIIATLANFYLTTWEEYHTGQLFLGVFSGPVEGILMIVAIFFVTGVRGPSFWDNRILTVTHLDRWFPSVTEKIPNVGLNEAFMIFGAAGLIFNIIGSYANVVKARHERGLKSRSTLLYLLPFVATCVLQVAWLAAPSIEQSAILHSPLFLPFACGWGLQFAHMVGRMILAHVTKQPFPVWDSMWAWSMIGALDVQLPGLFGLAPIIQSTPARTAVFVWASFVLSLLAYARFIVLVIRDITNFLGIACLTVRKKNSHGEWVEAAVADHEKRL